MGESEAGVLRLDFDRRLKLEFHGSKVTSDAGLLPYRELDDALGLTEMAEERFVDPRTGRNGRHGMTGLFRQSTFGRLGGYEDVNDADRLGLDPACSAIIGPSLRSHLGNVGYSNQRRGRVYRGMRSKGDKGKTMVNYIVATIREWNIDVFHKKISRLPGKWLLITDRDNLNIDLVKELDPRYIFFPHWNWKVDESVFESAECIVFHESDVPFGRGGSPLQNLIQRGYRETVLTALRMTKGFDEGPVYLKRQLSLEGIAEEIFMRTANLVADMIEEIVQREPSPQPQAGEPVIFQRRTPEQSRIPAEDVSLLTLFDHIRMLDADGYPRAFLEYGGFRFLLRNPVLRVGKIEAIVEIVEEESGD